jgi:aldehyde dehydrogenase (NAD+)
MNAFSQAFERQQQYFRTDVTKSYEWRVEQLNRLERLVAENRDAFDAALAADFKTVAFEQDIETGGALAAIADAKEHLAEWMRPEPVALPPALAASNHHASVYHEPYGVSLLIAPFNAPLVLLADPLVAILAAGNTAIVKPSESVPATAALIERLFADYFEPEVVSVVLGQRKAMADLLQLPFDFIFFTGSTHVGKLVMRAAAEHLTPLVLELGGQNVAVVDETANIADAAAKLVWGATAFAGQWCVSPGYVYVHESVAEQFITAAKAAVERFYGTDPKASPDLSRIITERDVERLAKMIDPAKVVVGGDFDPHERYVAPTVVYPASWDDNVMQGEIFGPILPVLTYRDLDEVVAAVKAHPKGLAGYIFSRDQDRIEQMLTVLPFGGGAVNQTMMQVLLNALPFGGLGASGLGRYYGKAGFDALSHTKSILFSDPDTAIEEMLPPYTDSKAERFAALLAP